MKGLMKWTVLILFLVVCIQTVSAFSITGVQIDPSGSLTPATPVTANFKIDFSGVFPSDSEIQMFTDLDKPLWKYTIIVNGIENDNPAETGRTITITGFVLNYKTSDDVSVRVTLQGVAPAVSQTTNKTIIRVTEYDSDGKAVTSTQFEKTALVINTGEVTTVIAAGDAGLQVYRTHIDEKAALGIDTSAAEIKYNEARQELESARSRPSNQFAEALVDLKESSAAIEAGETALDKAWAENEVAAAQVPITNVDAIIGWFKGNSSTANDNQLPAIVAKREVAVSYLSNAMDDIANGKYSQARVKAQDAYLKANESYVDALARQEKLSSGIIPSLPNIGGSLFIIVGIIAVILVVVGIIIYRKRTQWDELG
jgi:hypothetical protein